jgi:hypothetical protein
VIIDLQVVSRDVNLHHQRMLFGIIQKGLSHLFQLSVSCHLFIHEIQ